MTLFAFKSISIPHPDVPLFCLCNTIFFSLKLTGSNTRFLISTRQSNTLLRYLASIINPSFRFQCHVIYILYWCFFLIRTVYVFLISSNVLLLLFLFRTWITIQSTIRLRFSKVFLNQYYNHLLSSLLLNIICLCLWTSFFINLLTLLIFKC